jgi:Flp pilus assembly protein protease CpaA
LQTFLLFFYMAVAGGIISLAVLCWKGMLWTMLCQAWVNLVDWILHRPPKEGRMVRNRTMETKGIPYGVAIGLGMMILYIRGPVL